MASNNIGEQRRGISASDNSESECAFAQGGVVEFIDTSGARDGSRGLAFKNDRLLINLDGTLHDIEYAKIKDVRIINSFEDAFADELSIKGDGFEVRISDYSLDKFELKKVIEDIRRDSEENARLSRQVEEYAEQIAVKLAKSTQSRDAQRVENAAKARKTPVPPKTELIDDLMLKENEHPVIEETSVEIPHRAAFPEDYSPAPIPEEKINWLSGANSRPLNVLDTINFTESSGEGEIPEIPEVPAPEPVRPKPPEIMSGVVDRIPVIGGIKPPAPDKSAEKEPEALEKAKSADSTKAENEPPEPSDLDMRERIGNMDETEMMSFLSETINEINEEPQSDEVPAEPVLETVPSNVPEISDKADAPVKETPKAPEKPPSKWAKLTVEPIWGDIYIKASADLRKLCENGKLTMEQMEAEIKERLLPTAEAFEKIIGDESRVPKVMIPKISELKAAVDGFDSYFEYGEDIAVRAMFFMLYQMLSYADRIVESPETKDRLNDFFRRFGSAGITLSMLDMRV